MKMDNFRLWSRTCAEFSNLRARCAIFLQAASEKIADWRMRSDFAGMRLFLLVTLLTFVLLSSSACQNVKSWN
jgi:hypothetical protein